MSHTEASTPHDSDHVTINDHVTNNPSHVTTFQFPCDVQVLDSDTPDVIYSPRISRDPGGGLTTCQACRNTQLFNTPPSYEQSQQKSLGKQSPKKTISCIHQVNRNTPPQVLPVTSQPLRSFGVVHSKQNEKKLFHSVMDKGNRNGSVENIVSV